MIERSPKAAVADFVRGGEPPATTEFAYMYRRRASAGRRPGGLRPLRLRQAELHGDAKSPFTLYVLARMAALADIPPVPPRRVLEWANQCREDQAGGRLVRPREGSPPFAPATWNRPEPPSGIRATALESSTPPQPGRAQPRSTSRRPGRVGPLSVRSSEEGAGSSSDLAMSARAERSHLLDWLEFQVFRPQIEGPLFDRVFPVNPFTH